MEQNQQSLTFLFRADMPFEHVGCVCHDQIKNSDHFCKDAMYS